MLLNKMSPTYNHTTTIAISVFLLMSMLLAFVMQVVRWRNDYEEYVTFNNPGIEMFTVEVVALVYSFSFVVLQTQLPKFAVGNSEVIFHIVVMFCAGFALVWAFAFIASLIAYSSNIMLWFFFAVNAVQSLLLPYAFYRLKIMHNEFSADNRLVGPLARMSVSDQGKLLQEMETMRRKLESIELNNRRSSGSWTFQPPVDQTTCFPVQDSKVDDASAETFISGPAPRRRVEFQIEEPRPPPRRRSPAAAYTLL